MREAESAWISKHLARIDISALSPLVNLGSSDLRQRQKEFPQIWGPLAARGVEAVHVDFKAGPGIDISGDIFDPATQAEIWRHRPKSIMCCNMLEHVPQPKELARICGGFGAGVLIVSVPYSYPYHADPIDTMFRPDLETLARLFDGFALVEGEIIDDLSAWQTARKHHNAAWIAAHYTHAALMLMPTAIRGSEALRARYHRFLWLFRPYRITCAIFEHH